MPTRRGGTPGSRWKRDELMFARWAGGFRHPSQGVAFPDITQLPQGPLFPGKWTAEHKSTQDMPQWLRKAVDQARLNKATYPDATPFIFVTYHAPTGRQTIRLAIREVVITEDEADVIDLFSDFDFEDSEDEEELEDAA